MHPAEGTDPGLRFVDAAPHALEGAPGSAPGAPLRSRDGTRTGRPGADRLSTARHLAPILTPFTKRGGAGTCR